MQISRLQHNRFLEDELQLNVDDFQKKLKSPALSLLEDGKLYKAQFLGFKSGQLIVKMSLNGSLPRRNEHLYCFTVPKNLRDSKNWANMTYGDIIKSKNLSTSCSCTWQSMTEDKKFSLVGFSGIDKEFEKNMQDAGQIILLLGPDIPPYEYIANLQKLVCRSHEEYDDIIDNNFNKHKISPLLLDNKNNKHLILSESYVNDRLALIGPPGTGKTYLIAQICKELLLQGKSVLVTALTNRALMEVASKESLEDALNAGLISKTNLTSDETNEISQLQPETEILPINGRLILSTFYIASGVAVAKDGKSKFDYVIMDEASQAFLGMFAAACLLGKKNIWIGDTQQMAPIVLMNEDKIKEKNYTLLVNGFMAVTEFSYMPVYQLTCTYRLQDRGAKYTGIWYNNTLRSLSNDNYNSYFNALGSVKQFFNPQGGPTLIKMPMEVSKRPKNAIIFATQLANYLHSQIPKLEIAILSFYVDTTKVVQQFMMQTCGYSKQILIDTVSRIQGLTTDVVIYIIPNIGLSNSLEYRLFNVATSRAKKNTIIIADGGILANNNINVCVATFLKKLDVEFSFDLSNGYYLQQP